MAAFYEAIAAPGDCRRLRGHEASGLWMLLLSSWD
jgi:hypothetical protein